MIVSVFMVCVDDIVVIGNDPCEVESLKSYQGREFHIKDLCRLRCLLGIELALPKKGLFMSQRKYVLDLLQ